MKVICNTDFNWNHTMTEEYHFGSEPVEITQEAFDHAEHVFGKGFLTIVEETQAVVASEIPQTVVVEEKKKTKKTKTE